MSFTFPDSIVALSSGRLPSGIAIIRISGPQTRSAIETIAGACPVPRIAAYRSFHDPFHKRIDSGLLLFFPGPQSFTGEDSAEFHLHGGKAVVAAVLDVLVGIEGVRHAEAGEFTRRAFLNGKVDLLEAEALADLVAAETEAQRRLAVLNSEGVQSELYREWRRRLIHARAMIEAELDFADESDVPGSVAETVWRDMAELSGAVKAHIDGYHRAEMIRDGFDVVIVGAPNAGKSSLLNALARREAAIVSDEAGTTRDLVEIVLDLAGIKVRVTDTAGIRSGAGKVEAIGIERAMARAAKADLLLYLVDASVPVLLDAVLPPVETLRIGTKIDLLDKPLSLPGQADAAVSAASGSGIDELLSRIGEMATRLIGSGGDVLPSRLRHVALLRRTLSCLESSLMQDDRGLELRADDLRQAGDSLGRISGAVDVEDLLDVIFSEFCIGK